MTDPELFNIRLGISGTYWSKRPQYCVVFNDCVIKQGHIVGDSGQTEYVEFVADCSTPTATLSVHLLNKQDSDTVQSNDKTTIVKDLLLNIDSLEIDNIDLGSVPYAVSEYLPDHDKQIVKNCLNLGWNGVWSLTWRNPFHHWLIDNL